MSCLSMMVHEIYSKYFGKHFIWFVLIKYKAYKFFTKLKEICWFRKYLFLILKYVHSLKYKDVIALYILSEISLSANIERITRNVKNNFWQYDLRMLFLKETRTVSWREELCTVLLTLQWETWKIATFTEFAIFGPMWHLLGFYLNYIVRKQL
jgi:hypothetical protein